MLESWRHIPRRQRFYVTPVQCCRWSTASSKSHTPAQRRSRSTAWSKSHTPVQRHRRSTARSTSHTPAQRHRRSTARSTSHTSSQRRMTNHEAPSAHTCWRHKFPAKWRHKFSTTWHHKRVDIILKESMSMSGKVVSRIMTTLHYQTDYVTVAEIVVQCLSWCDASRHH